MARSVRVVQKPTVASLEKQTGRAGPLLEVVDNWVMMVTCLRHPPFHDPSGRWCLYPRSASWHAMQLAHSPSSLCTICMIGRCRHKGCRSLQGSWLACRHQRISEMKSESAAAHSRLEGPVPCCLHPSSSNNSVRYSPTACLFLSQHWLVNHRDVICPKKKKKRQLNKWLIVA